MTGEEGQPGPTGETSDERPNRSTGRSRAREKAAGEGRASPGNGSPDAGASAGEQEPAGEDAARDEAGDAHVSEQGIDGFGVFVRPQPRKAARAGSAAASDEQEEAGADEEDWLVPDDIQREAVIRYEARHKRNAYEAPSKQKGYDVVSQDPAKGKTRRIEVKGMKGAWKDDASVVLSHSQFEDATNLPDDAPKGTESWLYVVDQTLSRLSLTGYSPPG